MEEPELRQNVKSTWHWREGEKKLSHEPYWKVLCHHAESPGREISARHIQDPLATQERIPH